MPLKLSPETIDILKNFASINPNLVINEGSKFSTISEAKNIMASVTVPEKFGRTFGVYDLNEFISVLGLITDGVIDLKEDAALISSGGTSVKYRFANPSVLTTPQKEIKMPAADLNILISNDLLTKARKAASVLGHSVLAIQGTATGAITLGVIDPKDSSSNEYTVELAEKHDLGKEFSFQFLIENLKLLTGDYKVAISSKLISEWVHSTATVKYFIALEKTSTI